MFVNTKITLLPLMVVNSVVEVLAHPQEIPKRAVCNHDNLLRALLQSSVTASSFCSSFIPIPTATSYVYPTPTITPTFVSSTVTVAGYLVYPDGTHLESVAIPTFISTYPASRISSACSCLSLPQSFTTVTVTQSTQTLTTTSTATATVGGVCATQTPYKYAVNYTIPEGQSYVQYPTPGKFAFLNNAYACCEECQPNFYFPNNCLAWLGGPGFCYLLYNPPTPTGVGCGFGGTTVFEDQALAPNNLGGPGPCASSEPITVKSA